MAGKQYSLKLNKNIFTNFLFNFSKYFESAIQIVYKQKTLLLFYY